MIFEVINGSFGYGKDSFVLQDVSFSVEDGDVLSILGPNGVGKTTLLKCMMGFLEWKKGGSFLDGKNISELNQRKLWQKIAYIPQAKNTVSSYTVKEMILLGRSAHIGTLSLPGEKDLEKAEKAMETVGITYLSDRICSRISGGELQMVLIARALATEPEMLVLDEPESNLDFKNQLIILDTIKKLSQNNGITSVFNTHYPAHALNISNKSLILSRGGRSVFGRATEVINADNMKKCFSVNVHITNYVNDNTTYNMVIPLNIA